MSNELYEVKLENTKLKDMVIGDGQATIIFEHDQIILRDFHDQDCCESVYADWSTLELYKDQLKDTYKSFAIRGVKGEGLLLCFGTGDYYPLNKVFIACYDAQNGYYNDGLELEVEHSGVKTKVSIADYEEHIDV